MPSHEMQLKILMPFTTFTDLSGVVSLVVETRQGSLGILPRRLDCVAVLDSGILSYICAGKGERFIALDEGILVKTGSIVRVSTQRAVGGDDLDSLHTLIREEFCLQNNQEKDRHATMLKLESGFLRRFASLQH